jgi:hypothetical protein
MDLNNLIDYTLLPDPINSPGVQTLKFTDADLAQIVKSSEWKEAQLATSQSCCPVEVLYRVKKRQTRNAGF